MRFQELREIVEECEPPNKLTLSYQNGTTGRFRWTKEKRKLFVQGSEEEKTNGMCLKTDIRYIYW